MHRVPFKIKIQNWFRDFSKSDIQKSNELTETVDRTRSAGGTASKFGSSKIDLNLSLITVHGHVVCDIPSNDQVRE